MTQQNTTPYHTERLLFFVASSVLFILFGLYVYFISVSVVRVIARKEVDREIAHAHSRIGKLESAYIAAQQAISLDIIVQYGFVSAPLSKIYVEKAPTNLVLLTP